MSATNYITDYVVYNRFKLKWDPTQLLSKKSGGAFGTLYTLEPPFLNTSFPFSPFFDSATSPKTLNPIILTTHFFSAYKRLHLVAVCVEDREMDAIASSSVVPKMNLRSFRTNVSSSL